MNDQPTTDPGVSPPSTRHVIEHALTDYGYSPDVARALVDNVVADESR